MIANDRWRHGESWLYRYIPYSLYPSLPLYLLYLLTTTPFSPYPSIYIPPFPTLPYPIPSLPSHLYPSLPFLTPFPPYPPIYLSLPLLTPFPPYPSLPFLTPFPSYPSIPLLTPFPTFPSLPFLTPPFSPSLSHFHFYPVHSSFLPFHPWMIAEIFVGGVGGGRASLTKFLP